MKKKRKILSVLRCVLFVLVSAVAGFGLYRWNAQSLVGNAMPMPFGVGVGVVMSGSMEPELSVNDVIFVAKAKDYAVGDVVVYQDKDLLVVHKIIAIDGETVTTQGTANNVADAPISTDLIKGKVTAHIDGLGGAVTWLKSPLGTLAVLLAAGVLVLWSYAADGEEKDEDREKIEEIRREIAALKEKTDNTQK